MAVVVSEAMGLTALAERTGAGPPIQEVEVTARTEIMSGEVRGSLSADPEQAAGVRS